MNQHDSPLVSIGIPTYNRAGGYLDIALQSAMRQTYEPLEIIISDNCSNDHTQEMITSISDPRLRYFRQDPSLDPNDNFNFCLKQAKGHYFLLLHDDDIIDTDFVEACMKAAAGRTDIGIIRTGTRLINDNGTILKENANLVSGLPFWEFVMGWFHHKTALYLCSTLFNTQFLQAIGGFQSKTNLFQDVVAEMVLAARHGMADVQAVKASYRRHGANRGDAVKVDQWAEDCLYLMNVIDELAPPEHRETLHKTGMRYLCIKTYRKAANITNPILRWLSYIKIYRRFGRILSPRHIIRDNDVKRLKTKIRQILPSRTTP